MRAAFLYHSLIRSTARIKKNLNKPLFFIASLSIHRRMTPERQGYAVVGLGGVTNGGKTTLCAQLKNRLDADVFNMDDYFWPENSPNHTHLPAFKGHANWDTVSAVDFDRLLRDVNAWIFKHSDNNETNSPTLDKTSHKPVLIVEGILVLNFKPLLDLYDCKFYVTLTKDECVERRNKRIYDPADPDGYFDQIVWPMHLKFKAELDDRKDIDVIPGTQNWDKTLEYMLKHISNLN